MADTPIKIVCLDGYTLNPGDLDWAPIRELGEFVVHERTPADQILARSRGAQSLLTNKTPLAAAVIEALPELRYVGVLATGYNVVDTAAARRRGVVVTNIPTYGTQSVAQHAAALLLELARHTCAHHQAVRQDRWSASEDFCFTVAPMMELTGKSLGIVGLGRIGQAFARIAAAMGMVILAHDAVRPDPAHLEGLEVHWTELDLLFAQADVVSLHCPLTQTSQHLVNARRLAMMKRDAMLINTSRGPLVDTRALAEALHAGHLGGAALDVLEIEPPPADDPILSAPRCIITPHVAWASRQARQRLMALAARNLRDFLDGRPANVVH